MCITSKNVTFLLQDVAWASKHHSDVFCLFKTCKCVRNMLGGKDIVSFLFVSHYTLKIHQKCLTSFFVTAKNVTFTFPDFLWCSKHQTYLLSYFPTCISVKRYLVYCFLISKHVISAFFSLFDL